MKRTTEPSSGPDARDLSYGIPDAQVAQELPGYLAGLEEMSTLLMNIVSKADANPMDTVLLTAGVAKIGSGMANLLTLGASSMVTSPISVAASSVEAVQRNRLKREAQGRDQLTGSGLTRKTGKHTGIESTKGAATYGLGMGARAVAEQAGQVFAELAGSSIPIIGGLGQITLGIRSLIRANDLAVSIGLSRQMGDLKLVRNMIDGTLTSLLSMQHQVGRPETRGLLTDIIKGMMDLNKEVADLMVNTLQADQGVSRPRAAAFSRSVSSSS
jgi:hypothetical protein